MLDNNQVPRQVGEHRLQRPTTSSMSIENFDRWQMLDNNPANRGQSCITEPSAGVQNWTANWVSKTALVAVLADCIQDYHCALSTRLALEPRQTRGLHSTRLIAGALLDALSVVWRFFRPPSERRWLHFFSARVQENWLRKPLVPKDKLLMHDSSIRHSTLRQRHRPY